jgi:hypothetical protein
VLNNSQTIRWVVAAGGYRSGSTLQYSLLGEYLEAASFGARVGLVNPDDLQALGEQQWTSSDGIGVAKTHHVVESFRQFERPKAWEVEVLARRARPVSTARDMQGTRRSMCRKFGYTDDALDASVEWRENIANQRRWAELGAFEQRYELLVDNPVQALVELCIALDLPWSSDSAQHAATATDRKSAITVMQHTEQGTWDPLTLLHWDHVEVDATP